VEIIARRQESSTTWANPDGTVSTQLDSGPVRYLRAGRWENIDSTLLHDLTGQIRTRSTPNSVSLFNGDTATSRRTSGDRPLLRFDRGSSSLTLAWRGSMPPPQVTGNTATYPSVTPGTDVVVTSTPAGLQQNTVLTSRPGTAVSYTVPIKMRGLSTRVKHGAGVDFVDNNGIVVATMPEPQMWAANIDPVSQTKSKLAPVAYKVAQKEYGVDVILTPDPSFLADPTVQYPVTIDPDINFKGTFDTTVKQGITSDQSTTAELQVGIDSTGKPARSFINWDPSAIRGKQIIEAHLGLWNSYSATCANRSIDVYSSGLASNATRWTAGGTGTTGQPATASTKSGSTTGSMGQASCAAGYIYTPSHALDSLVQTWANTTSGQVGLALKASSETDISYYKRFLSSENSSGKPFMYVTYNSLDMPATADSRSASGVTNCVVSDARPTVNTETPALSARVTDPEGSQTVKAQFEWWSVDDGAVAGSAVSTAVASGRVVSVIVPPEQMKAGNAYAWRLRTFDNVSWGPYSGPCEFLVDPPPAVLDVDPAILATMQSQKILEPALQKIWDANTVPGSGFAGVSYEGDGLSLYWKGALSAEMSNAVAQARSVGSVTVKPAPYSLAQLEAEGEKIHVAVDSLGGNSDIQSIAYNTEGTGIVVEREPPPAEGQIFEVQASATEVLQEAQVTVPVEVTTADAPADPMAFNRFHDVPGYNGGGAFETYNTAGDNVNSCTLGFGLRMEAIDYIISAGHCGNSGNDVYFGEFNGGSGKDFKKIGKVVSAVKKYDLLLIKAPANNRIWDGKVSTTNSIGVRGWSYWAKNQLVCFSGTRTGTMCNLKQLRSRDVKFRDGTTVRGVIETRQMNGKVAATFGDSGSPVYTYDGGSVTAKGILSGGGGSTMYFQDWADVRREYPAAQLKTAKR
jgi:hypothetical protein